MAKKYKQQHQQYEDWHKDNLLQPRQKQYTDKLRALVKDLRNTDKRLVFVAGLPSTGKTKSSIEIGVQQVLERKYTKLIIIRPILIPEFGFLPGNAEEKMQYYLRQARQYVDDSTLDGFKRLVENNKIEFIPADQLQGSRFMDAYVVADEFQNVPKSQTFKFLSRVGEGCKFVVIGDISKGQANKKIKHGDTLIDYCLDVFGGKEYSACHFLYDYSDILGDTVTVDIIKTLIPDFT